MLDLAHWQQIWQALDVSADEALYHQLIKAYAQPQRHYHTQQHLVECVEHYAHFQAHMSYPAEVALALWFHDAIYDVYAQDNELKSAEWATRCMRQMGVNNASITRVGQMILATASHAPPSLSEDMQAVVVLQDQQILLDIDLAILAADANRFVQYDQQIRAEYAWVPEQNYQTLRAQVLGGFLARERIYLTDMGYHLFESAARLNLQRAVSAIGA